MVIFTYDTIKSFIKKSKCNQIVADSFNNWYTIMDKGDFAGLNELRDVFNTVDFVGNDRYVFNIMGNHYRVIAMIHFNVRTVYVLFIGTHKQYDKVDAKKVEFKN